MRNLPVSVAGKTGTAQIGNDSYNALFVCAAPSESPDVVISVVLEQGQSGPNASLTAARILEAYYGVKTDQSAPLG
jgi:cell division protein FtsI/penicillin-binding protein 2